MVYDYAVDVDLRQDLNLTMDLTVAMKCEHLGADYIDSAGQSMDSTPHLKMEPAHFQLSPNQQEWAECAYPPPVPHSRARAKSHAHTALEHTHTLSPTLKHTLGTLSPTSLCHNEGILLQV